MPRELITVQVGQCGNQIGCRFWELAIHEHAAYNTKGVYDEALSSFFKNVDARFEPPINLPVGAGTAPIRSLKARAVIVDMEEGVINNMLRGPLADILDTHQLIYDVSGAGNNWAHGHHGYGPQYHDQLVDKVRTTVEDCDSLQGFLLLHSLGGGTGSGLGSYLLGLLQEEFPEVFRFSVSVFPSADDDVVTSPYNALLSLGQLVEHADLVLPLENQALMDICERTNNKMMKGGAKLPGALSGPKGPGSKKVKPFDSMNAIAANLLLNLTSSVRFEGSLNVDINDIVMNMVPFPRLHFVTSGMSPMVAPKDVGKIWAPRTIDQLILDAFSYDHQLTKADPRQSTYLACALVARGAITISDLTRNLPRLKASMRMVHWNMEGFKMGLCSRPPVGLTSSLLCLTNNCSIAQTFTTMRERFDKLYKRRLFLHHYQEYMDISGFDQAVETVQDVANRYMEMDRDPTPAPERRMRPRGLTYL